MGGKADAPALFFMFKPSKILMRRFNKFNQLYFDGRLPECQVGFDDELRPEILGELFGLTEEEDTTLKHFQIHIAPRVDQTTEQLLMTLLHEMAHLSLYPHVKHGKKFNAEMLRIANRGGFDGLW